MTQHNPQALRVHDVPSAGAAASASAPADGAMAARPYIYIYIYNAMSFGNLLQGPSVLVSAPAKQVLSPTGT